MTRVRSGVLVALVVWLTAAAALLVTAVRAMPALTSPDRGVFIDVAERLVAGDRLYVDVWDNKDPVFYYLTALGRLVSPLMDYAQELLWLAVLGIAVASVARRFTPGWLGPVGAAATALLAVTGQSYIAGYSYLPGAAVAAATIALMVDDRFVLAGIGLGAVGFTRSLVLPLVVVAVVVWLLRRRPPARRIGHLLIAALATASAFVTLLALRGELAGWFGMLVDNVGYSQGGLSSGSDPWSHLTSALGRNDWIAVASAVVLCAAVLVRASRRDDDGSAAARSFAIATLVTLAASLGVLAVTGLASYHAMLLQLPLALSSALVAAWFSPGWSMPAATVLLLPVIAWLLAGVPSPRLAMDDARDLEFKAGLLLQTSRQAAAILDVGPSGSYARLGLMFDSGHAKGLRDWHLACPRFHQYSFLPARTLDDVLDCVSQAPVILVDDSFDERFDPRNVDWGPFHAAATALLAADYDCVPHEGFRLCTRLPSH